MTRIQLARVPLPCADPEDIARELAAKHPGSQGIEWNRRGKEIVFFWWKP